MSKAVKRLENFLEKYTREKYFQDRVALIRKKIGIPEKGVAFPGIPPVYTIEFPANVLGISYREVNYPTFPARMDIKYSEILRKLPNAYKIIDIILFINIYILYNERHYEVFGRTGGSNGTVSLIEYRSEYFEMVGCCDCELKVTENYIDETSKKYPVVIGISPYASQNEVVDFVKDHWGHIQSYMDELVKKEEIPPFKQEKNFLSTLRRRTSKSKTIEDIIYKNKNLSLKQLALIVGEETGKIFDQGEISKLRNLAIKRREKTN